MSKFAFYLIGAICVLQLIIMVLSLCGINLGILSALKGVALALALIVPMSAAWNYIKLKPAVWKVLYFLFVLILLITIAIPTLKGFSIF